MGKGGLELLFQRAEELPVLVEKILVTYRDRPPFEKTGDVSVFLRLLDLEDSDRQHRHVGDGVCD